MNGLIRGALPGRIAALAPALLGLAVMAVGLAAVSGCTTCGTCGANGCSSVAGHGHGSGTGHHDWDVYDRCYPQRYSHMAAKEVNAAMTPQVQNGHVLDQTVWNYHFEPGTDKLTPGGLEHLAYVTRRRPQPDCVVYLQTAVDLPYDPACPERLAGARQELDARRIQAVQKFVTAHSAGRPVDFQVVVHDPSDPTLNSNGPGLSVQQMYTRFRGGLPTAAGVSAPLNATGGGR